MISNSRIGKSEKYKGPSRISHEEKDDQQGQLTTNVIKLVALEVVEAILHGPFTFAEVPMSDTTRHGYGCGCFTLHLMKVFKLLEVPTLGSAPLSSR